MTPFEIKIILHWHCVVDRFPNESAPLYEPTMARMVSDGILQRSEAPGLYITTPRGAKFVGMLCDTPLPEDGGWVDPRFPK